MARIPNWSLDIDGIYRIPIVVEFRLTRSLVESVISSMIHRGIKPNTIKTKGQVVAEAKLLLEKNGSNISWSFEDHKKESEEVFSRIFKDWKPDDDKLK